MLAALSTQLGSLKKLNETRRAHLNELGSHQRLIVAPLADGDSVPHAGVKRELSVSASSHFGRKSGPKRFRKNPMRSNDDVDFYSLPEVDYGSDSASSNQSLASSLKLENESSSEHSESDLQSKIEETNHEMSNVRKDLAKADANKRAVTAALSERKKKLLDMQRAKNAYCSLKRSEYCQRVLKEDFRAGLRQLDGNLRAHNLWLYPSLLTRLFRLRSTTTRSC
jgi:hypothetical protein